MKGNLLYEIRVSAVDRNQGLLVTGDGHRGKVGVEALVHLQHRRVTQIPFDDLVIIAPGKEKPGVLRLAQGVDRARMAF